MILADVDTNAVNHTLPVTDPVGPFGQTGAYTDEESKGNGTSSGLALLGQGRYFDPKSLRYINRFASIENEYQAKILPWAVTSSILRGVGNAYFEGLAAVPNLGSDAISFLTLKKVSLGHVPESWSHPVKSGTDKYSRAFEKFGEIGLAFGSTLSVVRPVSKAQQLRDALGDAANKPGVYVFPSERNGGKPYVGQAGNLFKRLYHWLTNGRLKDLSKLEHEVMENSSKFEREVRETEKITALDKDKTANKRYPVAEHRMPKP